MKVQKKSRKFTLRCSLRDFYYDLFILQHLSLTI
nr:MAG TPA: hypothetical protein [Caudoviricetes sp.]